MALNTLSKVNIFIILVVFKLTNAATNYLSDNTVSQHETSQSTLYPQNSLPQEYLLAYQKYIPAAKYIVSQTDSQTPVPVTSTEKAVYSLDNSKYLKSQATKFVHVNQVSRPHLYTLAKAVPPTVTTYTSTPSVGSEYNHYDKEIPKKYQYGYRVSNPHTGTEFGHSEVNDGVSARGYYHVLLPDGRLQNVKYWAGPSGYHATITYETQY